MFNLFQAFSGGCKVLRGSGPPAIQAGRPGPDGTCLQVSGYFYVELRIWRKSHSS